MDPDQTFSDLIEAMLSGDSALAAELAENLAEWVDNGGYVPDRLNKA